MNTILNRETFKYERLKRGMTQKQFADLLGYAKSTIAAKESGERPITARDRRMLEVIGRNEKEAAI